MSNISANATLAADKQRKAYHSPRLTDFGPVNELTHSGVVLDQDELQAIQSPDGFIPNY